MSTARGVRLEGIAVGGLGGSTSTLGFPLVDRLGGAAVAKAVTGGFLWRAHPRKRATRVLVLES